MNKWCCPNCFTEPEIKRKINEVGVFGRTCNYCESENQKTVGIEEIIEYIERIVDGLSIKLNQLPSNNMEEMDLFDILDKKLCFFGDEILKLEPRNLLKDILSLQTRDMSKKYVLPKMSMVEDKWSSFSSELKEKNRFFPQDELYKQIFKSGKNEEERGSNAFHTLVESLKKEYSINKSYYRARVSSNRLLADEMGAPPATSVTAGRANPVGIPYLYLAENEKTCIAEVRPYNGALVSVAALKLAKSLYILDLTTPRKRASFLIEENLMDTLKYIDLLDLFSKELSKPVPPHRTHLDYIPTQYLCEYFKSVCGFDGLAFNSSFGTGVNLVLFDVSNATCTEMKYYEISEISHTYDEFSV